MPSQKADLLLHPIRLRIVTAISAYRMTAQDLLEAMPDVPQTTLYRHINALVEGNILRVVEENPIRGTVERVYALAAPPSLTSEDFKGMTKQDYEQAFTVFLAAFVSDARRYLASKADGEEINPLADGLEVNKAQLYLSDEEYRAISQQLATILMAALENKPSAGRKRRVFSYLFIPVDA